ncbi:MULTISPECIES: hypothetical protein [Bacteroidales]|uniref:hypothetical protein n=1 Tax=Bacteroidales TaxID=171549 RepID=UPI001F3B3E4C|nr:MULTISPECIES: hypothetical protein [Bacteroidales]MCE8723484.1 hypothetical protein [Phocaeicola vulgatus]MCE8861363.1 hypothetical protein [Phocaeicola vulgatus]MCE9039944.1 hypothetical protein [Parabacteroides distasonis]MCG4725676.1 hypothetical protein [Phocaeicola vulgatus]
MPDKEDFIKKFISKREEQARLTKFAPDKTNAVTKEWRKKNSKSNNFCIKGKNIMGQGWRWGNVTDGV